MLQTSSVVFTITVKSTKVHRVSKFRQSDWLKKYIDFNTDKKKMKLVVLKKKCFKLMINSIYGKTMENLRKRINVRLVNNAKDYKKYASKPGFISKEKTV